MNFIKAIRWICGIGAFAVLISATVRHYGDTSPSPLPTMPAKQLQSKGGHHG